MIYNSKAPVTEKIEIDLTGPEGNVFVLMNYVSRLGKQLNFSNEKIVKIIEDMKSSDYENALNVFDDNLGEYVDLYRG